MAGRSTIDEGVLSIGRSYEVCGLTETITSYDGTDPQSRRGQPMPACVQWIWPVDRRTATAHDGEVTANLPKVDYSYTDGSSGHARLTKITYPNGRLLHYGYNTGADDALSRVSWLALRRSSRRSLLGFKKISRISTSISESNEAAQGNRPRLVGMFCHRHMNGSAE